MKYVKIVDALSELSKILSFDEHFKLKNFIIENFDKKILRCDYCLNLFATKSVVDNEFHQDGHYCSQECLDKAYRLAEAMEEY